MKLTMTLSGYPAMYTAYSDSTLTWTISVTSPCSTATLNSFNTGAQALVTMTATVLGPLIY